MTKRLLLCCADPREGELLAAAGHGPVEVLGVGKAAAAASLARILATAPSVGCVLLFGVCGAYPAPASPPALDVLDLCVVTESVFADEGAATEDGFLDLVSMELQPVASWRADPDLCGRVAAGLGVPSVRAAMESAACALACAAAGVRLVEIRCVSNRTGPRADGGFRIREAAARAQGAVERILDAEWLSA
jgi:nucleoside phosphorylase